MNYYKEALDALDKKKQTSASLVYKRNNEIRPLELRRIEINKEQNDANKELGELKTVKDKWNTIGNSLLGGLVGFSFVILLILTISAVNLYLISHGMAPINFISTVFKRICAAIAVGGVIFVGTSFDTFRCMYKYRGINIDSKIEEDTKKLDDLDKELDQINEKAIDLTDKMYESMRLISDIDCLKDEIKKSELDALKGLSTLPEFEDYLNICYEKSNIPNILDDTLGKDNPKIKKLEYKEINNERK